MKSKGMFLKVVMLAMVASSLNFSAYAGTVEASPEAKRELVTRIHWRELTALRRFWLPVAVPVPRSVAICLRRDHRG